MYYVFSSLTFSDILHFPALQFPLSRPLLVLFLQAGAPFPLSLFMFKFYHVQGSAKIPLPP